MESLYILRPARESDAGQVAKLLTELGYESGATEQFGHFFRSYLHHSACGVWVAEAREVLIGMASFSLRRALRLQGEIMEIEELAVDLTWRGKGVGSALVGMIKKTAKEKKCRKILVSTNKERESYQRQFYVKLGFIQKSQALFSLSLQERA